MVFNGFWSINHWPRWFFSLATIGLDGFAMVFGLATIGLNGFSMVANHWSNDGMVTIHRYGLPSIHEWVLLSKILPTVQHQPLYVDKLFEADETRVCIF